jgi:AraC-like DNA-binding protein
MMARPKKQVDAELLAKLARIGCSYEEIATICGCSAATLARRFAKQIALGRASLHKRLRKKQIELALKGSERMLVHLGQCLLSQRPGFDVGMAADLHIQDQTPKPIAPVTSLAEAMLYLQEYNIIPAFNEEQKKALENYGKADDGAKPDDNADGLPAVLTAMPEWIRRTPSQGRKRGGGKKKKAKDGDKKDDKGTPGGRLGGTP